MEESKDQILADFQSCTGIDDVGEAIMHLEASNWNLLSAIHNVMPDESQTLPSEREIHIPIEMTGEPHLPASAALNSLQPKRESLDPPFDEMMMTNDVTHTVGTRILKFKVHYKENVIPLEVPESETIGAIKATLHAEVGVPPCRQNLGGWNRLVPNLLTSSINDHTLLSSMHLPEDSDIYLSDGDLLGIPSGSSSSLNEENLRRNYRLHIMDFTNSKEYDLSFPGTKTVLEIKSDLRDVTNIPVRFQQWTGWPESVKDENVKLGELNLDGPLELILSRDESKKSKNKCVVLSSSESSESDFEDAAECFGVDDDMFATGSSPNRIMPLIPENVENEAEAVIHFEKEFTNRYGPIHPQFYQGTLAEALQASCQKPARERHPLVIYIHHDASVLTNVFCSQLLCSESVISYLTQNFVTWPWDLSQPSNETRLLNSVSLLLGPGVAHALRALTVDNLPALMIISKVRSTSEVLTVIPGDVCLDELMTRLMHAVDVFGSEISAEIREEEEREAREQVKREQDAAYEASLMADRAKAEARRQEEEEKQKKDMELQQMIQEQEELKKAMQKSLADQLPLEPPEDSPLPISHIRVRLPNGIMMSRRFLASDPLNLLLTYIGSQGYPTENYKVLASWPRRDLTTVDRFSTLEELKLYPKETVTLEEK